MPGGQKGNVALEKKMRKQQGESQPLPGSHVVWALTIFPISLTRKDKELFTHHSYHEKVARALRDPWGFLYPKAFGEWGFPDHAEFIIEVKPGSLTSWGFVPRRARVVAKLVKNHMRFRKLEKKV